MTTRLLRRSPGVRLLITAMLVALCVLVADAREASAAATPADVRIETVTAAGNARSNARTAPIDPSASLGATARTVVLPMRSDMLGASWLGSQASVQLRTRAAGAAWSRWITVSSARDEGPDGATAEAATMRGRQYVSAPVWVGRADVVQVRTMAPSVRLRDVRIVAIATGASSGAESRAATIRATSDEGVAMPSVLSRAAWRASAPRVAPDYAPELRALVVHHTVSSNGYSCASSANMIRGIQAYHMRSEGWNDIGYNFIIDRCGRIWEGRAGGVDRPVIGAHTYGFNTATAGIALLGTYEGAVPSAAARNALTRLIAWRSDVAHINPAWRSMLTARNSDKFQAGQRIVTRTVSGHRDLYRTACPGSGAYRQINPVRMAAWRYGGPKFVNPSAAATVGAGRVVTGLRVSAAASGSVYWRLELRRVSTNELVDVLTKPAAQRVDFRWDGTAAAVADYDLEYRLYARSRGQEARSWGSRVADVPPAPGLSLVSGPAATVTPNDDGVDDRVAAIVRLNNAASIRVDVMQAGSSTVVLSPIVWKHYRAASSIDLSFEVPAELADGSYDLRIRAYDSVAGRTQPIVVPFSISRV